MMQQQYSRRKLLELLGWGGAASSLSLLSACGGGEPEQAVSVIRSQPLTTELLAAELLAANLLDTNPGNQAATYRNVDRIAPTRVIKRGASVSTLPAHTRNLDGLTYEFSGKLCTLNDYMARNRTAGLLILKGGQIALERYGMGNDAQSRWTSFSVAKSVTSTLIGAAVQDGSIARLDDGVAKYVSALKGTAYEQNSIRDLLRMSSGIAWNETYSTSGDSDIARLYQAMLSGQAGAAMEVMRSRPRAAPPGTVFNYSTGESYVLGAVVAAATGSNLSDYFSKKIWAPAGMESDGYWMLDAPNGLEMGGNNFSARLRDYGRFGLFFAREGMLNGGSVLPRGWRDLAGHPDTAITACGKLYPDYSMGYGYQWWSFPSGADAIAPHDAAFSAEGVFGQFIYINTKEDVVAVVWSAWPSSWVDSAEAETFTLIGKAITALR